MSGMGGLEENDACSFDKFGIKIFFLILFCFIFNLVGQFFIEMEMCKEICNLGHGEFFSPKPLN